MLSFSFWFAAAGFGARIMLDRAFVDRLKAKEPAALRDLVAKHHGALVGLAGTIVKNRALAEDVAQETWIAVMANIDRFDGRAALSTWIIAILMNKAKTALRKEKRFVQLDIDGSLESGEPVVEASRFAADGHWATPPAELDGLDPERIVVGRQLWRTVKDFIETLPDGQRAVVLMRDVEGLSAEETCTALSISAENQRVLLHRARSKLRNFVEATLSREPQGGMALAKS
ncbi:RNA polymerase sigma factor [Methyloraptor flagellatus]|jgi:RNA polymerase sigma-70 factor (ECF subfamily)|uniref:RNA polymerase sigma factor n=1 Tax=Methyloraptor flagellatus TaxID=3162530 RepID=A0AAU7XG85_9HYPH